MNKLFAICIVALFAFAAAEDAVEKAGPNVLVQKKITNEDLVEGHELEVKLRVFNSGDDAAYDISVDDSNNWPSTFFTVSGKASAKWDKLNAGSNVTHTFTVVAKGNGHQILFTDSGAAMVSFKDSPKGEEITTRSSSLGETPINSAEGYRRATDQHIDEWGMFAALAFIPVGIPFLLYTYISMNYEHGVAQKEKSH
eukprot:GFYU01006410.1.p1 GENE.GFYU01006410.1~~GFYU01006410.1.p1  ORF type:complete len:197 (+),score=79.75 GFYU01006410.1:30-620(+)